MEEYFFLYLLNLVALIPSTSAISLSGIPNIARRLRSGRLNFSISILRLAMLGYFETVIDDKWLRATTTGGALPILPFSFFRFDATLLHLINYVKCPKESQGRPPKESALTRQGQIKKYAMGARAPRTILL